MSTTNINAGLPIKFDLGGTVTVTDGSTDYVLHNRAPGTLQVEPGGYEQLEFTELGAVQTPIEGNQKPTMVRLSLRLTHGDTTDIIALSKARVSGTGTIRAVKTYSVKIVWPQVVGQTTLKQLALTGCWFAGPVKIKEGNEFDTVEVELKSSDALGTDTPYTPS